MSAAPPSPQRARRWLLALAAATLLAAGTVIAGVPTVHLHPLWFWPLRTTALAPLWLGAAAASAGLAALALATPARRGLALLVLAALGLQLSLAFAEGRGEAALRDRAVRSGHAEFVRLAASGMPAGLVATRYEELAAHPDTQFVPSKPPGQLLIYIGLERLAGALWPAQTGPLPEGAIDARHWRYVRFLTYALPLLSALALIPLGALGRRLLPGDAGLGAAALYALSAPLALITLHLDQAIYPLLAGSLWWLSARAGASTDRTLVWGLAAGLTSWACAYVSFGLLPAAALAPVVTWAAAPREARARRALLLLGGLALGIGLGWAITAATTGYDALLRYRSAMAWHAAWKGWEPTPGLVLQAAVLNLTELLWWAGPAGVLFVVGVAGSLRRLRRGDGLDLLAAALGAGLLALSLAGRGVGESARLWLFLLPMLCLVAARRWDALGPGWRNWAGLLGLQWLWTVALKYGQDFW